MFFTTCLVMFLNYIVTFIISLAYSEASRFGDRVEFMLVGFFLNVGTLIALFHLIPEAHPITAQSLF